MSGQISYGQALSSITPSGLNTQVSAPVTGPGGAVQHNITGGTRPGGGANLFHSFGEFGVPTNNIANFLNDSGLPTSNILSRVNGGNPSNIFGTIQTEGFGNANLFLMNPAGIVFGPDASLNVGGAIHFTTANYLKLADGVQFTALPGAQDALLSIAPVAAFGFLGPNPEPISVEGGTLSVAEGHTLSLVGGNVTIGSSAIKAPGGQIAVFSVASPGEVLADTYASAPNLNGESFTTMGNIVLSEGAILDVSGDAGGSIIIRGGQLMMTDARLSADTENQNGASNAIDIQVSGDISVNATQAISAISARTTGDGNAGGVKIVAENFDAMFNETTDGFALIDTHTSGLGTGGLVDINVSGNLDVTGTPISSFFIDSGPRGFSESQGGDIMIRAGNIQLRDTNISSGDLFTRNIFRDFAFGSGGNVTIFSDDILQMTRAVIGTDGFFAKAGNLAVSAKNISLKDSNLSLIEAGGGGELSIITDSFIMDSSAVDLETEEGKGGDTSWIGINIDAEIVELKDGSVIRSQTIADGRAGDIHVTAREYLRLSDDPAAFGTFRRPSGLYTNSLGDFGHQGQAGAISIEAAKLEIIGGARINSSTQTSGRGGDITVITTESISLTGQRELPFNESDTFGVGSTLPSGIFSRTVGSEPDTCTGQCGEAGNISITTGTLTLDGGAAINSGTASTGKGGTISVNAANNIFVAGTLFDGTPGGVLSQTTGVDPASASGTGGDISLMAGQNFFLRNGARVAVNSEGPANAGNITITAGDTILIDKATVTTEAALASGGNIKLTANDTIHLIDSTIESSVQGDVNTAGGDISLDPDFIILQNSQILAKAVQGQGGNITLIANDAVLVDPFSVLDASSALGVSGSVNIQAPIQNLSGTIVPLPQDPVPVTALYGSRCVAGAGGHFSTFVDSKADSLAPTPGTFLASPFLPLSNLSKSGELGDAGMPTGGSGTSQAPHLQVAVYSPPVLFGYDDGILSACP